MAQGTFYIKCLRQFFDCLIFEFISAVCVEQADIFEASFYALEGFGVMQKIVSLFPLTRGIRLMKATSLGQPVEHIWIRVTVMAAVTVICTGVAVKCFKWE